MLPASLLSPQRRILVFVAVGCAAALVHWLTVVALVRSVHAPPLAANVGGWAVAFCVSFAGQAGLTFRDQGAPLAHSAPRFLLVSLGGFAVNEASYALLLRFSPWRYDLLLALVLLGVATLTYLLNRHWAFRRS
jgi:putative flippase GtrA